MQSLEARTGAALLGEIYLEPLIAHGLLHGDGVSVKKSRVFKQTDDLQPVSPLLNILHIGSDWLWALQYCHQYFLGMVESNRRTHPQNLGPVSI